MKRYGSMIRLRPEKYEESKRLHAADWPEILDSQLLDLPQGRLSVFLLRVCWKQLRCRHGADSGRPAHAKWWAVCKPCQEQLESRQPGEWWADMEELFHHD
jgi:L-rhamnose mutarotase